MQKSVKVKDGTKIHSIYKKGKRPLSLVFLHGVGSNHTVWNSEVTL